LNVIETGLLLTPLASRTSHVVGDLGWTMPQPEVKQAEVI